MPWSQGAHTVTLHGRHTHLSKQNVLENNLRCVAASDGDGVRGHARLRRVESLPPHAIAAHSRRQRRLLRYRRRHSDVGGACMRV
jgi:hypothetical protein